MVGFIVGLLGLRKDDAWDRGDFVGMAFVFVFVVAVRVNAW